MTVQAVITFNDDSCTTDQQSAIRTELEYTLQMAAQTKNHLQDGVYYETFFAAELRDDEDFAANVAQRYANIELMLAGTGYTVTATCNDQTKYCKNLGWYAHMSDAPLSKTGNMNFCNKFWTDTRIQKTADILGTCPVTTPNIVTAQRTRSAILMHELTHTSFTMSYQGR